MAVKFTSTLEEKEIAQRISQRVMALLTAQGVQEIPKNMILDIQMDLCAVHSNGCPIDFARLENADDFNLLHDVAGIGRHLDRSTGKLTGMFRLRFAKKEVA